MKKTNKYITGAVVGFALLTGVQGYHAYSLAQEVKTLQSHEKELNAHIKAVSKQLGDTQHDLAVVSENRNQVQSQLDTVMSDASQLKVEYDKAIQQRDALEKEKQSLEQKLASALPRPVVTPAPAPARQPVRTVAAHAESAGEWMTFRASFYNGAGITKSGHPTVDGFTVAVDPSIIPLGSMIEILYPDGHIEKRRADDTGGLIKGYRLDVFVAASESVINRLGVQQVKVRILKTS